MEFAVCKKGVAGMVEERTKNRALDYPEIMNRHLCPECGSIMAEVDSVSENGYLFVWYQCTRADCDGQWLQKTAILAQTA
jgi:hypothetical protein